MSWNVRIGINPISWMNDDLPELGGETPLETALSEGKEIGYAGFELGNKFAKDGLAFWLNWNPVRTTASPSRQKLPAAKHTWKSCNTTA